MSQVIEISKKALHIETKERSYMPTIHFILEVDFNITKTNKGNHSNREVIRFSLLQLTNTSILQSLLALFSHEDVSYHINYAVGRLITFSNLT